MNALRDTGNDPRRGVHEPDLGDFFKVKFPRGQIGTWSEFVVLDQVAYRRFAQIIPGAVERYIFEEALPVDGIEVVPGVAAGIFKNFC